MNRKNFLASIPFISSIPLIGKDIFRDSGNIVIVQPEEFNCKPDKIDPKIMSDCSVEDGPVKVVLMYNGHIVGEAGTDNLTVEDGHIDYASFEIPIHYYPRLSISARFEGPAYEKVMSNIYKSLRK